MKPIDYHYFAWLTSQVNTRQGRTYNELFDRLHSIEFVWTVPNDDNRIADGMDLRREFSERTEFSPSVEAVSILEVIVGLSRRLAFMTDWAAEIWAWKLIKNLKLHNMYDPLTSRKVDIIDEKIEALIWRTYEPDGSGGFFPLKNAKEDQTKVEIWYQMNAYVIEIQHL
jgi:hypothetical protein